MDCLVDVFLGCASMTKSYSVLQAIPVSADVFRPFGTLLDPILANPRLNFTVNLKNPRPQAKANMALIRPPVATLPFDVTVMEHHPFSEQIFIPMAQTSFLIVVAHDDGYGRPDPTTIKAFTVTSDLAISYHPNTWHTGMATLHKKGQFAMFIYEDGSADDCVYCDVNPFQVQVPDV
jgi:ureidoglycolate lyase